MKNIVGAYEAKTKLSALLRQVKKGKHFTITSRGEPIAELIPSPPIKGRDKTQAVEAMKQFMSIHRVPTVAIKAFIEKGRA